ncbi:hypothetical protein EMEDMD4_970011 [Sinorhizobium medicae]|uniref:Uncharacterized protein n=1 Tax=Sinorhizobium medicae TaxID=110321 RepID=A0A508X933_9HYPH|nr:hypothetical protein EMEDMD4_970011 [Sinorhizobium medicae]
MLVLLVEPSAALVGVTLQSYSKHAVRLYFTGMTKRGSTITILLLVVVPRHARRYDSPLGPQSL